MTATWRHWVGLAATILLIVVGLIALLGGEWIIAAACALGTAYGSYRLTVERRGRSLVHPRRP